MSNALAPGGTPANASDTTLRVGASVADAHLVDRYVGGLRDKLGDGIIESVSGSGYGYPSSAVGRPRVD